jgi:hypothetical protein
VTMIRSALSLAAQGVAVFPCCCRGKTPAVAGGLKAATTDRDQITAWWTANSDYNIAIATGEISNLFVVDVDGADAEIELQRLGLPATVEVTTARGKHYYFKYPNVSVRNSASKIARGIDVRATGGYCIAPPSVHESGHVYRWAGARAVAAAPDQLIAEISERTNGHSSPSELSDLFADTVREGCRNDTIARLAGFLIRRRVGVSAAGALLCGWNLQHCIPPLSDDEVATTVISVARAHLRNYPRGD